MENCNVLLVEDERLTQWALAASLRDRGFTVHVTNSGAEARELIDGLPAHLVILDADLADGSGKDLAEELARRGTATIVLTARRGIRESLRAMDMEIVSKPLQFDAVVDLVREQLRQQPCAAAA